MYRDGREKLPGQASAGALLHVRDETGRVRELASIYIAGLGERARRFASKSIHLVRVAKEAQNIYYDYAGFDRTSGAL